MVNSCFIPINFEGFPSLNQSHYNRIICLSANVEIACIVPATNVQSGNVFARFVIGIGGWSLSVKVKMFVVDRHLLCIVKMRSPVSDTVSIVHQHMAHFNIQKNIQ